MTYEETFLDTCDAEGLAPSWAITQIFAEHGSDLDAYLGQAGNDWDNGKTILNHLGY